MIVLGFLAQRRWSVPLLALALVRTFLRLRKIVPRGPSRNRILAGLTGRTLVLAVDQLKGLLLRHLWPLTVLGLGSRRMRRAAAAALVIDIATHMHRRKTDSLPFAVARRLDDLAYGAGVWHGAWRARSVKALLPDIRPRRR